MNTANTANAAHTAVSFSDIERSTVNLPLIGYTVFWRLAGIRVPHPELATAVATAGFTGFLPEPPSPRKALRRAIEAWISDRAIGSVGPALAADDEEEGDDDELSASGGRVQQRALVRLINDKEWLVFVIVAEAVDLTGLGLSYGTSLRVLYHKASGGIAITTDAEGVPALETDAQGRRLTDAFLPYWHEYRTLHISGDLSRLMRQTIGALQSVCLRPNGGLYFVPVGQADALQRLGALIEALPVAGDRVPFVCAQGVLNRPEAVRKFSSALYEGLVDEVNALASDLTRLTAGRAGSVKATTIEARLATYRQLRDKVELFTDVLSRRKGQLLERLETLTAQARAVLLGDAIAEEDEDQPDEQVAVAAEAGVGRLQQWTLDEVAG
jgi:hypothetical protein